MADKKEGLMLEYFVPIKSSADLDGDFTINGIAINETITSNGHNFIGEELSKSAHTLIGVPLLKDHDNSIDSIVGKVNGAHWDEALRNIPFKAIVKNAKVKQLIKDGLLNTVSVGAHVKPEDIEETEDGSVIPHNIQFKELSVVAVPADGGATFSMALNNSYNAYKSNSTKIVENSTKTERGDNMTEEEKKTTTEESKEEVKPETEVEKEAEVSDEEKALDEKIEKLRIEAKKKQLAIMEADADEKEEAKEEVKPVEKEEKVEDEAEEEEEEVVEEKGDYSFTEGNKSIGIQRKSYSYN